MTYTSTSRVAALRARRATLGLRRWEVYLHDDDWPAVRDLADSLTAARVAPVSPLVELGREWLANSPELPGPVASGLIGWTGPVGFVCAHCAGRIMGRGCDFKRLATEPVWQADPVPACALC